MPGVRLVRLLPPLMRGEWSLEPDRSPWRVGRSRGGGSGPEIDLWPDLSVSHRHATIRSALDGHWLEDIGSKGGTRLDGEEIEVGRAVRLAPGAVIEIGQSHLLVVAPSGQVIRHQGWGVEIDPPAMLSYVLACQDATLHGRVALHNCTDHALGPGRLDLSLEAYANASVAVPVVPARSRHLTARIDWSFDRSAIEAVRERRWAALTIRLDGETIASQSLGLWLLPPTDFSFAPEHRRSLAAFVLPSHPLTVRLAADGLASEPTGVGPGSLLRPLYDHLHSTWHINYRHEPPQHAAEAQRIRLPHDVLADPIARTGQGTCLDLALLVAALLEAHGAQPLIAVLDLYEPRTTRENETSGEPREQRPAPSAGSADALRQAQDRPRPPGVSTAYHALVGCWRRAGPRVDPIIEDSERLLADAAWVDPNGCTRDDTQRGDFETAQSKAVELLRRFPLLFALDVAAARSDGIEPLPFTGEPPWDRMTGGILAHAARFAEALGRTVSTVALLVGLLRAHGGVFRAAFAGRFGEPDAMADRLAAELPLPSTASGGSRNYRAILTNARMTAKVERAALVSELHLIACFLDIRSSALDAALRVLGTPRDALRQAVLSIAPSLPAPPGESTVPSLPRAGR